MNDQQQIELLEAVRGFIKLHPVPERREPYAQAADSDLILAKYGPHLGSVIINARQVVSEIETSS